MVVMTRRAYALQMQQLLPRQEMGKPKSTRKGSAPGSPQSPGSPGGAGKRRPIRPIDRQKMRPWLQDKLDSGELGEALWWREPGRVFAVRWPHAARQGFRLDDAKLFKAWASHSGIHQEGDEEDHKKWKSNFRCAIHSVPDIKEITVRNQRKGQNAVRVYEMLDQPREKRSKKDKNGRHINRFVVKEEDSSEEDRGDGSESNSGASTGPGNDLCPLTDQLTIQPVHKTENNIPDFSRLGVSTTGLIVNKDHLSGGMMREVKKEPPSPTGPAPSLPPNEPRPPYPVPTTTPQELQELFRQLEAGEVVAVQRAGEEEGEEEVEMRPVGIVTRLRSPSGDSGLPGSPRDDDVLTDQLQQQEQEELLDNDTLKQLLEENFTEDQGIVLSQTFEIQDVVTEGGWANLTLLDISTNAPTAVAVEDARAIGEEDFNYTGLQSMDTA